MGRSTGINIYNSRYFNCCWFLWLWCWRNKCWH